MGAPHLRTSLCADGWGGRVLSLRGSWLAWRSTAGHRLAPAQSVEPPPPLFSPSGLRGSGHWAPGNRRRLTPGWPLSTPRCRCHRPWVPPLPGVLLLCWLGLRWRRVPRAVAPVDESGAQGPGHPTLAYASVTRSTASPSMKTVHLGSAKDPFAPLLGHPTPGSTSWIPPSHRRSTASKGRLPLYPEVAQLSDPRTSSTTRRVPPPKGVGDGVQVPQPFVSVLSGTRGLRGSLCWLCPGLLRHRGKGHLCQLRALIPCCPGGGHPRRLRRPLPRRGGGVVRGAAVWGGWWQGSLAGAQGPQRGVDVGEGHGVVVVGALPRHLLDAGRDTPHLPDLRLRGFPTLLPLRVVPFAVPSPCPLLSPVLPVHSGPGRPLPPCPRVPCLPLVTCSCAPPPIRRLPPPLVCPPPPPLCLGALRPALHDRRPSAAPSVVSVSPGPLVPGSKRRCSCGSVMSMGVRLGAGAQAGCGLPSGRAALGAVDPFGGYDYGGLTWVWQHQLWARYFATSLLSFAPRAALCGRPSKAPRARVGPASRASGVEGAAA